MNYGEIIVDSFHVIWREKKLWLLGIIGLCIGAIASGSYMASWFNWQSNFMASLTDPGFLASGDPEEMIRTILGRMGGLVGGMAIMGCASVIGYIVNLVMRGATIGEAGRAWRGDSVDISRGASAGAQNGLYIFLIDLLWWIVPALLMLCGAIAGIILFATGLGVVMSAGEESAGAVFASIGTMFAFAGVLACVAFLVAIARGLFGPLMYQSLVLGDNSLGDAIKEGWSLAKNNLGPMVLFLLFLFVLQLVLQMIIQFASYPLMGVWMAGWIGMRVGLVETGILAPPSLGNSLLLVFGGLFVALVTLLVNSFLQTYALTLYARVYRILRDDQASQDRAVVADIPQTPDTAAA